MALAEKGSLLPSNSSDELTHSENPTGLVGVRTHSQPRAHCDQKKEVLFLTSLVSWVTLGQGQGGRKRRQDSKLRSPTTATRSWGGVPKVTAKCSYHMKVDGKLNKRQLSTKVSTHQLKTKVMEKCWWNILYHSLQGLRNKPTTNQIAKDKEKQKVIIKTQEKL